MTQSAFPQGNTTTFTFNASPNPLAPRVGTVDRSGSVNPNKRHRRFGVGEVVLGILFHSAVAFMAACFVMSVAAVVWAVMQ